MHLLTPLALALFTSLATPAAILVKSLNQPEGILARTSEWDLEKRQTLQPEAPPIDTDKLPWYDPNRYFNRNTPSSQPVLEAPPQPGGPGRPQNGPLPPTGPPAPEAPPEPGSPGDPNRSSMVTPLSGDSLAEIPEYDPTDMHSKERMR